MRTVMIAIFGALIHSTSTSVFPFQGPAEARHQAASISNSLRQTRESEEAARIRRVIERQQADWNRGDIEAFMQGYENSERVIFTSGGVIRRGWKETLRRYKETYPDREAMGTLTFSELEITLLEDVGAVALGKWELRRGSDRPHGVFSLVLRKGASGWKIIHDHTSSSP